MWLFLAHPHQTNFESPTHVPVCGIPTSGNGGDLKKTPATENLGIRTGKVESREYPLHRTYIYIKRIHILYHIYVKPYDHMNHIYDVYVYIYIYWYT